jgi:DNA invertase Pin-like site-specific DNA recombinase
MGKLIFSVCGAFAQFERSMIQQRIHAGLKRAQAQGKTLGRPKVDEATELAIQRSLKKGVGIKKTAAALGCGIGTVIRVRNEASA